MHAAKVIEIICQSPKSFDDAIQCGIKEASKSIRGIRSVWVKDQSCCIENNQIVKYRVILKLTFELEHD